MSDWVGRANTMPFGFRAARFTVLVGVALILLLVAAPHAKAQAGGIPPPEFSLKDKNNVDLVSFSLTFELADLSIGTREHLLAHTMYSGPLPDTLLGYGYFRDSYFSVLFVPASHPNPPCTDRDVIFGNSTEYFGGAGSGCVYSTGTAYAEGQTGSTLASTTYTQRDGTAFYFTAGAVSDGTGIGYHLDHIAYPDGRVSTLRNCADGVAVGALCSVTRSDGLQLKYNYAMMNGAAYLASIVAINNAYEYCSPTAGTCSLTKTWPTVTYSWSGSTGTLPSSSLIVTDAAGRQTRYTQDSKGRTVGIKLPSSATSDNLTYSYCDSSTNWCSKFVSSRDLSYQNYVQSVVRGGQTWTYVGDPGSANAANGTCGLGTYTATNPVGGVEKVFQDYCFPDMQLRRGAYGPGRTPFIQLQAVNGTIYDTGGSTSPPGVTSGRVTAITKPEGNQIQYTWDTRGNITKSVQVPKSGSSLAQVTTLANYDTTCASLITCNKPHWVQDGRGSQTAYTYDPVHGGVSTVTSPADARGIQAQTRYTYTQRYAWALNSSGAYVQSASPIWVLATESFCRTSAPPPQGSTGCNPAADEVVKTYEYGSNSGPNNLFLKGVAVSADGVTRRTCYGYDAMGNKVSGTEPSAALGSCP